MAEIFKAVMRCTEHALIKPLSLANKQQVIANPELAHHETRDDSLSTNKEQSMEEAFQAGYKQGFSAGEDQEKTRSTDKVSALTKLLHSIPNAISDNRLQLTAEIADIVLVIAQQFFINQQHDKKVVAQQITQIISQLNEKQNIELALHPQDLALLQQGELQVDLKSCKNIRIIADDNLRLGGCVISSEHGIFDAGLERQIDNLKQVLLQIKRGQEHD